MSVQAHPRFLRRRSNVREHRARRSVRRALWILITVMTVWAVAWVTQSPLFSVRTIGVAGAVRADVRGALVAEDVYVGRPLVLIRSGSVGAALEADPWVKQASVHRRFPDQIEIKVVERVEVAVVKSDTGWHTVSDDGHIMRPVSQPPAHLALIDPRLAYAGAGGERVSDSMMAVVEFVTALPGPLIAQTSLVPSGPELMAEVAGHRVRLGARTNMAAKAAALVAVLEDSRLEAGAVIDLIAPARPAVRSPDRDTLNPGVPQPLLEVESQPLETPEQGR